MGMATGEFELELGFINGSFGMNERIISYIDWEINYFEITA
jgi:hypothetical protein